MAGIRGLDLSKNLLPSWDTVALIASELPALETLAVKYIDWFFVMSSATYLFLNSYNRLCMPADASLFETAFSRLRELQITSTLTTWAEVRRLVSLMPSLRVLEVGYNRLHSLGPLGSDSLPDDTRLEVLNLDGNWLCRWSELCQALEWFTGYAISSVIRTSR